MSEANAPSPPRAAKQRHPVERALVWGFILVFGTLAAVEGYGWWSHQSAKGTLMSKVQMAESTNKGLQASEVATVMGRAPSRKQDVSKQNLRASAKSVDVYSWFSIDPRRDFKRELYVYYGVGEDPDVLLILEKEDDETMDKIGQTAGEDAEKIMKQAGADPNDTKPLGE